MWRKCDRRTNEEEAKRGKREIEGGGERVNINCKRVCFGFCASLSGNLVR